MATSFQPNNLQGKLFARGKRSYSGFVPALFLSLAFMVADYHYQYIGSLRTTFSLLVSPIQYVVDYPTYALDTLKSVFASKSTLMKENNALRHEQMLLQAKLQKLSWLHQENNQLTALLEATPPTTARMMAAEIMAVDTTSSRQFFILNKGKRDGVTVGQPVVDAKGLMGQIIDVGYMTSTVLLISDAKSAVPVRDNRTGEQAIITGMNDTTKLALINLPKTSVISKGDLLVTSGLGHRYPGGYPVGRVEEVKNIPGEEFIKVSVSPSALLNRSRLVLIIWPDIEAAALAAQISERMSVIEKNV